MSDELTKALQLLPHGAEFRFIDRLLRLEEGRSAAAEYTVRGDESFLRGHFPGEPLVPGVLLIEAIAQLAGITAQTDPTRAPMARLKLTAIRGAKIVGSAKPGERIHLEANVTGRLGHLVQATGKATVDGAVVIQVELTLSGEI